MVTHTITIVVLAMFLSGVSPKRCNAQSAQAPQARVIVQSSSRGTTLLGSLTGDELKTYVFGAQKGQTVRLELKSARASWLVMRLFPVTAPEGADVLNNFMSSEASLTGTIPSDGDYVVQIGLRRPEARRGGKAAYEMQLSLQDGRAATLEGTTWQLVRIQSMNDQTVAPDDRSKYTMSFENDGSLNVRADCNRGRASWKSSVAGELSLGPLALTRAICPPPSLHDRFVKDLPYVRSYIFKDGHLFVSLMADGGIYEFEPRPNDTPSPSDRATAQGPSFDCARASGLVEQTICADASLASLDRELSTVYKAAATKGGSPTPAWLRSEQNQWLSFRNRCSTPAADVRACVERAYTNRIVELQARFRLVKSTDPVVFSCSSDGRDELIATFHETSPASVLVERGDTTLLAIRVSSSSGTKYEGPNLTFSEDHGDTQVRWRTTELRCKRSK